jgi:hypothetical protein
MVHWDRHHFHRHSFQYHLGHQLDHQTLLSPLVQLTKIEENLHYSAEVQVRVECFKFHLIAK